MNGIFKDSLGDNSQIEQPYRTTGIIQLNSEGNVNSVTIKGIEVDFKIEYEADKYKTAEKPEDLLDYGYEKRGDGVWIYTIELSTTPWEY